MYVYPVSPQPCAFLMKNLANMNGVHPHNERIRNLWVVTEMPKCFVWLYSKSSIWHCFQSLKYLNINYSACLGGREEEQTPKQKPTQNCKSHLVFSVLKSQ